MANKKQQDNPGGREVVVGGDNGVGGGHDVADNSLGHFSLDDVPDGVLDDLSGLRGRNQPKVLRRRVRRS